MSQRIVQIIQGVFNPSAGPTYSVARLAEELCAAGRDCEVSTIGAPPLSWPYQAHLNRYDGWLERKAGVAVGQWRDLRRESARPCILHAHGVWRAANVFPLFLPTRHQATIIVSPRGMLSAWSFHHKRWRKMPFWLAFQAPALARSHAFHATADSEYEDLRQAGFRQPVAVIPNGVEIPELPAEARQRRLVFLSRIDPKKGLEMLIGAWNRLASEYPDWELVIAGPLGSAYANTIQQLATDTKAPRLSFAGEVTGDAKRRLLASASLFVLPTYSENFGIAVAEALAHGTPVVTTTGTPWHGLVARQAGWWVEPAQEPIEGALRSAMGLPLGELEAMGQRGRAWMQADYGWHQIGVQMGATYDWLQGEGDKPGFVRVD